jgi:hypothetical protein
MLSGHPAGDKLLPAVFQRAQVLFVVSAHFEGQTDAILRDQVSRMTD